MTPTLRNAGHLPGHMAGQMAGHMAGHLAGHMAGHMAGHVAGPYGRAKMVGFLWIWGQIFIDFRTLRFNPF